jgi:hypothetical protein
MKILDLHRPCTLDQYDACTELLILAARMQGASSVDLNELTDARKRERRRLEDLIDGRCADY